MSIPFYDQEYNTRLPGVDVKSIIREWRQRSAQIREDHVICHENVSYDTNGSARETMDLFLSSPKIISTQSCSSSRWLVFIHGGYWRSMTKGNFSFVAKPFVTEGINVALLEYDLCPTVALREIVQQCRKAIAWLYHDSGFPCEKLLITGHSAGGHLTAMMFATDWMTKYSVPNQAIVGGVAISGLFDLDPILYTAMNDDLRLKEEDVIELSPTRLQPMVQAPLVLVVGGRESSEFHRQSQVLKGAAGWDPVATEIITIDQCHHFDILEVFLDLESEIWVPFASIFLYRQRKNDEISSSSSGCETHCKKRFELEADLQSSLVVEE